MEQEALAGVVSYIEDLTEAGKELREHREARMSSQRKESEAEKKCLALMHLNGVEAYNDDRVSPPVKLRIVKPGKEKVSIADSEKKEDEDD